MMNQIVIVGRLTKNPEVKELENGTKVANITLAVPRSYKNIDGVYENDFIKCSLWNSVAENTASYCKQGDLVGIKGRVQSRVIETENGKHSEMELVAEKITFLTNAKEKENSNEMDM